MTHPAPTGSAGECARCCIAGTELNSSADAPPTAFPLDPYLAPATADAAVQTGYRGSSHWEAREQALREMGFHDRAAVREALREAHGDVDAALELLLAGV